MTPQEEQEVRELVRALKRRLGRGGVRLTYAQGDLALRLIQAGGRAVEREERFRRDLGLLEDFEQADREYQAVLGADPWLAPDLIGPERSEGPSIAPRTHVLDGDEGGGR